MWVQLVDEYGPNDFEYIYQYKDHLGNTRLSYSDMDDDGYINDVHHTFWDGFESQRGWILVNQYGTTLPSGTDTFKYYFNNPTLVNSGTYSGQVHNPENLIKGNQEIRILERDRDNWIIIDNPTATEYTYSAWVYSNGPNVSLTLKMKSSSGYITETIGVGTTTRMEWVKLEGTVNVPANVVSLNIQLKNMGQRPNTTGYTVWYDDVSIKKTGSEIVEEDNYYPFGLKHKGYNIAVNGGNDKAQKWKYQGQERNDELNLNWDSFKWRNYDYAIGRFMSVDPLAEKYVYNSPYAFQENKLGMGVELEGLEMTSERSKDGKSVTITTRVRPINNVKYDGEKVSRLSDNIFNQLVKMRIQFEERVYSGKTAEGLQMNWKVVVDPEATLVWDYRDGVSAPTTGWPAMGYTHKEGDTQNNTTEVSVTGVFGRDLNVPVDSNGNIIVDDETVQEAARTGAHETGHEGGLQHETETKNAAELEDLNMNIPTMDLDKRNLMLQQHNGNAIGPNQRSIILNNVESQQEP